MSQQVRDAVARLDKWTTYKASNGLTVWEFGSIEDGTYTTATNHPIPDDLTACAEAWDRHAGKHGWRRFCWPRIIDGKACVVMIAEDHVTPGPGVSLVVRCTGDNHAAELRDRWEMLGLVLEKRGVV